MQKKICYNILGVDQDEEIYDSCIIAFTLVKDLNSNQQKDCEVDNYDVSVEIQPKKDEYKSGYYVDGNLLVPEIEMNKDGFLLIIVPKGYYEYNVFVKVANVQQLVIDVEKCFEEYI